MERTKFFQAYHREASIQFSEIEEVFCRLSPELTRVAW
jgi:hypothetical protein